jgi:hypothetical protein
MSRRWQASPACFTRPFILASWTGRVAFSSKTDANAKGGNPHLLLRRLTLAVSGLRQFVPLECRAHVAQERRDGRRADEAHPRLVVNKWSTHFLSRTIFRRVLRAPRNQEEHVARGRHRPHLGGPEPRPERQPDPTQAKRAAVRRLEVAPEPWREPLSRSLSPSPLPD